MDLAIFTSYKVYYLLYLMYIQHRLDNTIGKIVFRHVPKFVDSNSTLALLFSLPPPLPPPICIFLYTMNRRHTEVIRLTNYYYYFIFFFYENSARRVYINYRTCVYVGEIRDARIVCMVCVCLSLFL